MVLRSNTMRWLLAAAALAPAVGCLVVTPLDDLPSSVGGKSSGGSASGGKGSGTGGTASHAGSGGTGGTAAGGKPPGDESCQTNEDCVKLYNDVGRCRQSDHQCVKLRTPQCPVVYGDAKSPNAIYFGAFATLDETTPEDNSIAWAHELAIDELCGDNIGGIPGPDNSRSPLVMVLCNNGTGASDLDLALDHLINEAEVPAIIATLQPGDLRRAYEDPKFKNRDVFYLSPVPDTTTVETVDKDDRIWTMLGEPRDFAPTYAALLALAEKHVRATQSKEQQAIPLKVALVASDDAFGSELTSAVTKVLRFNGKSLTDNGSDFTSKTISGSKPDLATMAAEVANQGPDIVISTAGDAFVMTSGLQDNLEITWDVSAPQVLDTGTSKMVPKARPFYILSPYNAGRLNDLVKRISDTLERAPTSEEQQRYVGVSIASAPDKTLQNAFAIQLGARHKGAIVDTANYYDAVYFLAYAMYGANQPGNLTGTGIAAGMQRLLDGDPVNVGPDDINTVFAAPADDKFGFHVLSTLGPPDFDPDTGVRPVDGSVFCIDRTNTTAKVKSDVLRYDRQAGALDGVFPCISGFFP